MKAPALTEQTCLDWFQRLRADCHALLGTVYEQGLDAASAARVVNLAGEVSELVAERELPGAFRGFRDYEPFPLTHPLLVATFALMTCRKLDWNTERTLQAVGVGALLHDVGMTKLPEHVKGTHPNDLAPEDLVHYHKHCEHGMNIVAAVPLIPVAVQQIIYQHHELSGKGFPHGISNVKVYPLAKVVCLGDRFARFLILNGLSPLDGLKKFAAQKEELLLHDPEIIRAFIKSFIKDEKSR
jgi:putative nucleotidyltransferase with HDIG domain